MPLARRRAAAALRPSAAASLGRFARLLALGWIAALGSASAGVTVRDDQGSLHRFDAPPQRIVSLLPSLAESMCALGACARLVAVDRYTNWPGELDRLPRVGGLEDPQIEAIATLRPDLVLASRWARSLDRLQELGIPVVRLQAETHADMRRTLLQLATLLGQPEVGERVWAAIERDLAAAARRVPASVRGQRVYFEIGGGPFAAGAGSFIGQTLARLGLVNIVPTDMPRFPKLTPEFVLLAGPQWVMGDRTQAAARAQRTGWAELPALRQHQVCSFATPQYEMLIRPGPRLGEAARLVADCLARSAR